MKNFIYLVERELLPKLKIASVDPDDPIEVQYVPKPWLLVGTGNYAAVIYHPNYPNFAIKKYADGRPGLKEEADVYRQLGQHPAYSEMYHAGSSYLVLKRLTGTTLWNCVIKGTFIPESVIKDIDGALAYAKHRGLHPHDVHGKNVMMMDGKGVVVDVSDFYKTSECRKWKDLRKAYFKFYSPFFSKFLVPVSPTVLNLLRKTYKLYAKIKRASYL